MKQVMVALVVLLVAVVGCTSTGSSSTSPDLLSDEMSRPTYEADGRVYSVTDCPLAENLISGGYAAADGLPKKGQTDKARVESLLAEAQSYYVGSSGIVAVTLIRRNGEVWAGPGNGDYTVETVEDYQYELLLGPDTPCPTAPTSWGGIPLLYNRASGS
jgi:hypothetical protein